MRNLRKMRCRCFRDLPALREIYPGCCRPTTFRPCPGVFRMSRAIDITAGVVIAPTSRGAKQTHAPVATILLRHRRLAGGIAAQKGCGTIAR